MVISHRNKFLFIHNDKCAGTAIKNHFCTHKQFKVDLIGHWGQGMTPDLWKESLSPKWQIDGGKYFGDIMGFPTQHSNAVTLNAYFELMGWNWNEYFKFGIVRNPFDRIVSGYEWRRSVVTQWVSDKKNIANKNNFKNIVSETDGGFKEFVKRKCKKWNHQEKYFYTNKTKECIVDFIGRYENLEQDFKHIVKTILPNATDKLYTLPNPDITSKPSNASIRRKDYRSYYDEETRDIVEQRLSNDLELFEYTF